jgi:D-sedoheptulose 7-phosphate isomerase
MMHPFFTQYRETLHSLIDSLNIKDFQACTEILLDAYRRDAQIFIAGNGGSAASANHFVCDFGKNAVLGGKRRFRILSLCDNIENITAIGNDISYEDIFRQQLINLMRAGDVLIVLSASGNSPNILRACEYAKEHGGKLIALTGFDGGAASRAADAGIIAPVHTYEQSEDIHLIVLHMFVCYFKEHQGLFD